MEETSVTEYEIADLAFSRQMEIQGLGSVLIDMLALASDAITQYMSVLFGYIAVAWFVGPQLSRTQLWIFTVLYVFWQLLTVGTVFFRSQSVQAMMNRMETLVADAPAAVDSANEVGLMIGSSIVTLLLLALLASLYFMWSVRSVKNSV